jgi:chromosome segregation ATPase
MDIIQTYIIPVSVSLGTGLLGSWLFLKPRISQRDEYIEELEKGTKKYGKQLKDKTNSLTQNENTIKKLKEESYQKGNMINKAREKISELNNSSQELISEKDSHLETLNNALKNKEQNILKLTKRVQETESTGKRQRLELNQRVETITDLQNQLQERNDQLLSLKDEIADLTITTQNTITERENHIGKLSSSIEIKDDKINNLTEHLQGKEETIKGLQDQISKKEESIQEQKNQFHEQSLYIKNLTEERSDLLEEIQKAQAHSEAREIEMGNTLKTKDLEYATLQQSKRRMQDDFSHILGIGQKISSTLKNAGIKSFSKLATTEVIQIRDILEKENPALLKLSDPSTWPEQARIAAEGDWDALSNLQNSIKASKTRARPVDQNIEMEPMPAES